MLETRSRLRSTSITRHRGARRGINVEIPSANILPVLWHRRRIILACVAFALVAGIGYLLKTAPVYRSVSRIYIQQNQPKLIGDGLVVSTESVNYLLTQCDVMRSNSVLATALESPAVAQAKSIRESDNPIGHLKKVVNTQVGKQSEVIAISAEAPQPEEAAVIVNAVVDAYISYQNKTRRGTASEVLKILRKEKGEQEAEYSRLQALMLVFKKKNAAWSSFEGDKGNVVLTRLAELTQALTAAQMDAMRLRATVEGADAIKGNPAEIRLFMKAQEQLDKEKQQTPTATLTNEMFQLRARSAQLKGAYGSGYPQARSYDQQLEGLSKFVDEVEMQDAANYVALVHQQLKAAEQRVAVLQKAVDQHQEVANALNGTSAEYADLDNNLRRTEKLLDALDSRIKEIHVTGDSDASTSISILEVGKPEYDRVRPGRIQVLALSLLAGLMVGMAGALTQDWLDHRLRSADEVASLLDLPVLGIVPRSEGRLTPQACAQETHLNRASAVAEAYRTIRTAVQFADVEAGAKTLLITSPFAGDGKTTVASNLAIALAQSGRRVLLVDADGRRPRVHAVYGLEESPGLSDVLMGQDTVFGSIHLSVIENLDILPAGSTSAAPAEMFDGPSFAGLMAELASRYDRIIIDSPPVVPVTDARILAASSHATVLVLRAEKSTRSMCEQARAALASVNANVIGVVVNDMPKRGDSSNYYGGYGYAPIRSESGKTSGNGNGDTYLNRDSADVKPGGIIATNR